MFGKYTFSYDPTPECGDPGVSMSFSGEADLSEILEHFGNFLRATGHPLDFDQGIRVISADDMR